MFAGFDLQFGNQDACSLPIDGKKYRARALNNRNLVARQFRPGIHSFGLATGNRQSDGK